jgi:MFS transporter, DHA1 family, inner membrane transport protein
VSLTPAHKTAVLIVGIIGVLIPGLQPQLLGALALEGRLSAAAVGGLASVELLAMGIAAAAAGSMLSVHRLRAIAVTALLVTGLCDVMTPYLGAGGIFAARIVAGFGEGVLIWIAIGLIVRSDHPERWSGIYLMLQTLAQFAVASALGMAASDSFGGFTALGAISVCGLLALRWLPSAYPPLSAGDAEGGRPSARGLFALIGVVLYLAYIVAVWVYVEPLGLQLGIPPAAVHLVAPLSLAMQVLGAGAATLLAPRLPARLTIVLVGVANLGLLSLIAAPPTATLFIAATAAFGFLWLFVMPFQVPVIIAADPTRNAAVLIGGAQLIGSSLGPFIAGQLVGETNVLPVLPFGALCLIAGVIALVTAGWTRHDPGP